ncbi:U-box domain-containing protein 31 [Glycine soja]|uniref:U-box domain-containing protein n=1 Tax=Glycine soja TaxID=3848 RepID=A0A0B2SIH9_GLYSO|nr:U-box domain-containing protein 31 [Glycine soja]RZC09407.1 U-box domain-containing protein 31 [Glycine soja]
MPMFEPPCKNDGFEVQILDLDMAVKDGVLGGGVDYGIVGNGICEKLNLAKMIEELDLCEVSSVFICPISLELMHDLVTLCIGQTYERCNILKWFSLDHFTCLTTMQELWDDSLTPNTTLHCLIST